MCVNNFFIFLLFDFFLSLLTSVVSRSMLIASEFDASDLDKIIRYFLYDLFLVES